MLSGEQNQVSLSYFSNIRIKRLNGVDSDYIQSYESLCLFHFFVKPNILSIYMPSAHFILHQMDMLLVSHDGVVDKWIPMVAICQVQSGVCGNWSFPMHKIRDAYFHSATFEKCGWIIYVDIFIYRHYGLDCVHVWMSSMLFVHTINCWMIGVWF